MPFVTQEWILWLLAFLKYIYI